jgi:DNA-binding IclR family transcriptional regulator
MTATRPPIRVLGNAAALAELLAERGELTPAELAEATGIPRPSVYRLVDGLAAVGLAALAGDGRVRLGVRCLHLGEAARAALSEWSGAQAILDQLSEQTEQTAYLTVRREYEAVCVEWTPGRGIGLLILRPGRTLPLHAGGAGRALLAASADSDTYLTRAPFPAFTDKTLTTARQLRDDITHVHRAGYVLSADDVTVGIGAVAVAVTDPAGNAVGALSLAGRTNDIVQRQTEFAQLLREQAPLALNTAAQPSSR